MALCPRISRERLIIGLSIVGVVVFNVRLWALVHNLEDPPRFPIPNTGTGPYPDFPVFVVGLPKVGTTSIHSMFNCNGFRSSHYCCCGSNRTHTHCNDGGRTFAECMRNNIKKSRPILEGCGDYDVYAQMDAELGKSMFLPQRFHLEKLHEYAPNATFVLNLRPDVDWVHSVTNWFGLGGRFLRLFRVDIERTDRNQALIDIFNNHSTYIREFVKSHPSHALVEVDISCPNAGMVLAKSFGLRDSCWGKHNVNRKATL